MLIIVSKQEKHIDMSISQ